jgi:3-hydroxymyristoyl/3-hydroxydecanoyl-(acyl carrier protein) dehydratase
LRVFPHQRPARFIDEIVELQPSHILTRYTWREEDCAGHFPGNPVVPGVKMLEMAAQTAIVAWGLFLNVETDQNKDPFFTKVDRALFKKMVRPAEVVLCRANFGKDGYFKCHHIQAETEIKFLGGPKDGEIIFSGKVTGVWVPRDSEDLT